MMNYEYQKYLIGIVIFSQYCICNMEYGVVFHGEVIEEIRITGLQLCTRECVYLSGQCKSINFHLSDLVCQLNADDKENKPENLKTDPNYVYSSINIYGHIYIELNPGKDYCFSASFHTKPDPGLPSGGICDLNTLKTFKRHLTGACGTTPCINGYFRCIPLKHGKKCLPFCPPGFFVSMTKKCTSCPSGTFQDKYGSNTCMPCTLGFYQDRPQSRSCNECPIGTYLPYKGGIMCMPCQNGTYTASTASAECQQYTNVALGKNATQSTTKQDYEAGTAIDGNRDTCAHTLNNGTQYWEVNLATKCSISRIVIIINETSDNRDQHIKASVGIEINNVTECGTYKGGARQNSEISLKCNSVLTGRYVSVEQENNADDYPLILCEVEVYGIPAP